MPKHSDTPSNRRADAGTTGSASHRRHAEAARTTRVSMRPEFVLNLPCSQSGRDGHELPWKRRHLLQRHPDRGNYRCARVAAAEVTMATQQGWLRRFAPWISTPSCQATLRRSCHSTQAAQPPPADAAGVNATGGLDGFARRRARDVTPAASLSPRRPCQNRCSRRTGLHGRPRPIYAARRTDPARLPPLSRPRASASSTPACPSDLCIPRVSACTTT